MRIAAVQMRSGTRAQPNIDALTGLVTHASEAGARYVLTPEVSLVFAKDSTGLAREAKPFEGNEGIASLSRLAAKLGIHLHLGSLAVALEDGKFANRSVLFGPDGQILAHYDKIHLFDAMLTGLKAYRESDSYRAGDAAVTVPLDPFTLGMSICYDVRFGALYNVLAGAGANLMAVPAAFTVPTGQAHWEVLLRARAIETGAYVIAAAQGGQHESGRATYGHSMIIDPWGRVVAERADDREGVVLADIDLAEVDEARRRIPALANARPFGLKRGSADGARILRKGLA
ncbi:carbon-nitrogen hydrolase family protein [Devosia rhodophyticola]|uniref:Carbon-nitrogen hydrolase family protein n=1 Tax=Devosia rhodophyticola TaxID=3026423 RepID=A0ABY7YUH9_9HYPH|nr:carbon-nitrogen hydrolase family protein [Devosia rhodophyticola]WDR04705.1 carbon-nitrogen hydrolase family protein [Devosia rhodophyticola]